MRRSFTLFGPAIAYAFLIFVVSSFPSLKSPDIGLSFEDKIYHVLEYGIFGVLLQRCTKASGFRIPLTVFAIGALYGASDEIHQLFVPGRQCELFDFLADAVGVAFGQFFFLGRQYLQKSRKKNV
jgi:VanZ family protein